MKAPILIYFTEGYGELTESELLYLSNFKDYELILVNSKVFEGKEVEVGAGFVPTDVKVNKSFEEAVGEYEAYIKSFEVLL